jgi:hypothetical protein
MRRLLWLLAVVLLVSGCGHVVTGAATWPGERLARVALDRDDFPPGVQYERLEDEPGKPDGRGGPPAMLSQPQGCSEGLSRIIASSAERGPGSAVRYVVAYDGARILVTVLSWSLDLGGLAAEADRCAEFQTFFAPPTQGGEPGIPMTTTPLPTSRPDTLVYRQTMRLGGTESSVYFWFANVGPAAVFAVAFPTPNPRIPVKAQLPQTFQDVARRQSERLADR